MQPQINRFLWLTETNCRSSSCSILYLGSSLHNSQQLHLQLDRISTIQTTKDLFSACFLFVQILCSRNASDVNQLKANKPRKMHFADQKVHTHIARIRSREIKLEFLLLLFFAVHFILLNLRNFL